MKYSETQERKTKKKDSGERVKELFLQVEEKINVRQTLSKNKDACTLKNFVSRK